MCLHSFHALPMSACGLCHFSFSLTDLRLRAELQGHAIKNQDLLIASGTISLKGSEGMSAVDDDVAAAVRPFHKSLVHRYNVLIQFLCLFVFQFLSDPYLVSTLLLFTSSGFLPIEYHRHAYIPNTFIPAPMKPVPRILIISHLPWSLAIRHPFHSLFPCFPPHSMNLYPVSHPLPIYLHFTTTNTPRPRCPPPNTRPRALRDR
jgi:hypothetical protein